MSNSTDAATDPLTAIGIQLAQIIKQELAGVATNSRAEAPMWMNKAEAIEYTRLKPGTFREYAAAGRIPSHGGKTKVFKREELDRALDSM